MVRKVSTLLNISSDPLPDRQLDATPFASSSGTLWKSQRMAVKYVRAAAVSRRWGGVVVGLLCFHFDLLDGYWAMLRMLSRLSGI